ncbi:MAG: DUF1614 domain-containing protein [Bacillota bacterium]
MPVGSVVLVIAAVAALFGLLHRVLDRMGLTDWGAALWIAFIIGGSYVNVVVIRAPELRVNIGGALVPLLLAAFLIRRADTSVERGRAVMAAVLTGVLVFGLGKLLPEDPGTMVIDPLWAFSLTAGIVAYLLGRSRRSAFIAGTLGIAVADVLQYAEVVTRGLSGRIWLGGGGAFDAAIVAGIIAVGTAEIVGEVRERLHRRERISSEGGRT